MLLEDMQLGHYKIIQRIGGGGSGDVYLAEDPKIKQKVAIKVIKTEATLTINDNTMKLMQDFQEEAKAIAQLDHPHILQLLGYGEDQVHGDTIAYIVMPYRQEGNLVQWLQQQPKSNELSLIDRGRLIQQAASALQYAHDHKVVHRDVKPSNFLVRENPINPRQPDLLLSDFGLAKLMNMTSSASQRLRGTPAYMAPEQWNGTAKAASDQYALAVMAYELLVGRTPFQGNPFQMMNFHLNTPPPAPSSFNSSLPQGVDSVLLRALQKQPSDRYLSIAAFAESLLKALSGVKSSADPVDTHEQSSRGSSPYTEDAGTIDKTYLQSASYQPPTYSGPPRQPKTKMLIAVLAALLVVAVTAGVFALNAFHSSTPTSPSTGDTIDTQATISAQNNATAQALAAQGAANAQSTANAQLTANAQPTPTPVQSPVWSVILNSATSSLRYNNYTVTNPATTHFLIVDLSYANLSSQTQVINGSLLDLQDSTGNHYSEDQASTPQQSFYVNAGQSIQAQNAYVVPDSECHFTLVFTDPSGKATSWTIQVNSNYCSV